MTSRKTYYLHWFVIALILLFCAIDSIYCFVHHPVEYYVAIGDVRKVEAWAEEEAQRGDHSKLLGALLFVAIANRNGEMIYSLLRSGANPNVFDAEMTTPIYRAVLSNKPEIVALLLDAGADPRLKEFGPDAFQLALGGESRSMIEVFLRRGIYPDQTEIDSINDPSLRDFITSSMQDSMVHKNGEK